MTVRAKQREYEAVDGLELFDSAGLFQFDSATRPHET
jgi:hypothetical protein